MGVDILVKLGLPERDALDAIFTVATVLAEQKILPEFPDDTADVEHQGRWLVAAAELKFFDVLLEIVSE